MSAFEVVLFSALAPRAGFGTAMFGAVVHHSMVPCKISMEWLVPGSLLLRRRREYFDFCILAWLHEGCGDVSTSSNGFFHNFGSDDCRSFISAPFGAEMRFRSCNAASIVYVQGSLCVKASLCKSLLYLCKISLCKLCPATGTSNLKQKLERRTLLSNCTCHG